MEEQKEFSSRIIKELFRDIFYNKEYSGNRKITMITDKNGYNLVKQYIKNIKTINRWKNR